MCSHVSLSPRLRLSAIALGLCAPLTAFAQTTVPAPPSISPTPAPVPVAEPIAVESNERRLIPVPGFLKPGKKDAPVTADPLLDQTSGTVPARRDLSDMPVSRIQVPELQSVPEADLPAILRSKEEPKAESGPFGLFGKDEPVAADMPAAESRIPPVAATEAAPSAKVQTLRAAETQADSFTAALAVAQDATPVAAPDPMAEPVAMQEKDGMLSSIGGLFKKDEPAADKPVATGKKGLFSGLFGEKDKEPEALTTPVPGISDVGQSVGEQAAEKKGLRLPKLFGRE